MFNPNDNKDLRQKLKDMSNLTILANRMNEVQEANLKRYPFVFFNGVKVAKIDYDLSKVDDDGLMNHGDHYIAYHLEIDEKAVNAELDKRFFCISEATRVLFWNDLKVRVFINNKLAYETKHE